MTLNSHIDLLLTQSVVTLFRDKANYDRITEEAFIKVLKAHLQSKVQALIDYNPLLIVHKNSPAPNPEFKVLYSPLYILSPFYYDSTIPEWHKHKSPDQTFFSPQGYSTPNPEDFYIVFHKDEIHIKSPNHEPFIYKLINDNFIHQP